jgi:hypothetical protein
MCAATGSRLRWRTTSRATTASLPRCAPCLTCAVACMFCLAPPRGPPRIRRRAALSATSAVPVAFTRVFEAYNRVTDASATLVRCPRVVNRPKRSTRTLRRRRSSSRTSARRTRARRSRTRTASRRARSSSTSRPCLRRAGSGTRRSRCSQTSIRASATASGGSSCRRVLLQPARPLCSCFTKYWLRLWPQGRCAPRRYVFQQRSLVQMAQATTSMPPCC